MNLKFYKIRPEAKLPVRAHRTDAGMDLFYCPNGDRGVGMADGGEYWIPARVSGLVSTGLKTEIPEGYMLEIKNKPGDKIAQAVLVPVVHCGIEEAAEDNLNYGATRGEGGFGSTGDR